MGHNTSFMFLNDCFATIQNDPDFGKRVAEAIQKGFGKTNVDVIASNGQTVGQMIESHHADTTTLLAVGGNYGTKLGEFWGFSHHTKEAQVHILKEYADKLGYKIVKKPSKK